MDVLENMANKFQNLSDKTSEKDPNGMKKAGNNLLLGIGNVLDASVAKPASPELGQTEEEDTVDEDKVNVTKVCRAYFFLSLQGGFLFLIDYDPGVLFANIHSAGLRGFKFNRTVFTGEN